MNGFPDREPVLPPLALADMVSGVYGASAAMMALREVEVNGGSGQVIDLSLFEPIHAILGPEAANLRMSGVPTRRNGSKASNTAPRNVYACSDGRYVALSASMQSMAERLFGAMDRPDLITDPRFATNTDRVRHNDEIDAIVADFIRQRTQAENLALFDRAGVTVGPVCDAADLQDHPFVTGREVLVELPDTDVGSLPMHDVVPRLSGTPGGFRRPAPAVGADTREILASLGLTDERIDALARDGIVSFPE
jgi:formyl-CoA transferase